MPSNKYISFGKIPLFGVKSRKEGTWVWHWMTSCPLLPTSLWQPALADSSSTTSAWSTVPHQGGGAGSGPGSCYLTPRLLQLPPGWCACMCHKTSAAHSECSNPAGLQPTKYPHSTASPRPALATGGCSNPIQDTGTSLPCCDWLRPILHPPTMLCYCQTACYSLTTGENHVCSLSWLHNGGTSFPLTSWQQKLYTSFIADWRLIC